MKRLLFILSLVCLLITACKKGENDPTLSLTGRTSRLSGHWVLTSGNLSSTWDNYNITYLFDGMEVEAWQSYAAGWPIMGVYPAILSIDFDKENAFKLDESIDGNRTLLSGKWTFNAKTDMYKAKQVITLEAGTVTKGKTKDCALMQFSEVCSYEITRLSKDELVLYALQKFSGATTSNQKIIAEYFFEKQD